MANYEINDIYDIATAFIMDKNTKIDFDQDVEKDKICYKFTRHGLTDTPYCLCISATRKAPTWHQEASAHPMSDGRIHTEKRKFKKKNYGTITLSAEKEYRICGEPTKINDKLLTYTTKHEVGSALDKGQSDMNRFLTRIKSRKFFNLLDLAEKRISGQIKTTDNSKQIFDMIYRLKENTK